MNWKYKILYLYKTKLCAKAMSKKIGTNGDRFTIYKKKIDQNIVFKIRKITFPLCFMTIILIRFIDN